MAGKNQKVIVMVITICKKCDTISNALFSGICDKCFYKERNAKKKCSECGCEETRYYLSKGKCSRCYQRLRAKKNLCFDCGRYCTGKRCRNCYNIFLLKLGQPRKDVRKHYLQKKTEVTQIRKLPDKKLLKSPHTRAQYFKEKYG